MYNVYLPINIDVIVAVVTDSALVVECCVTENEREDHDEDTHHYCIGLRARDMDGK